MSWRTAEIDLRGLMVIALAIGAGWSTEYLSAIEIYRAEYEGRPQFKITTEQVTYYYDTAGGGFSRMIDRDGRDWIAFHKDPLQENPASAATGFRGIPNLVFGRENPDAGAGHPGFEQCESSVVGHDRIRTQSKSGNWIWNWQFTERNAVLTLEKVSTKFAYWFLYEGPIGGRWSPRSHYWGTDQGGPNRTTPTTSDPVLSNLRWAYFGDDSVDRVLLAIQVERDELVDTLWYMPSTREGLDAADGMVVFGFGRDRRSKPLFMETGKRFMIGFVELKIDDRENQSLIAAAAQEWLESIENKSRQPVTIIRESQPIDPQCRKFLDSLAESNPPGWDELGAEAARDAFSSLSQFFGSGPANVATEDRLLGGGVSSRIYKSASVGVDSLPGVMLFHGGGWVLGDVDTHDSLCRKLAVQAKCVVVSIDYRRAPEHRFPAAFDDCYFATQFVSEHASELGIDSSRLVVMGDSAGGNLAAAVALKAHRFLQPSLLGQVLVYPALDAACDSPSYSIYGEKHGLTATTMKWFWEQYIADTEPSIFASPASAQDLSGLPKTAIITAEYDILRDEAETYAERLIQAGVDVKLHRYGGVIHGFVHFAGVFDRGNVALSDIASTLVEWFQMPSP